MIPGSYGSPARRGGANLVLSSTRFMSGTAADALLAVVAAPAGWGVSIVSGVDFAGRVKLSGRQLLAATALNSGATGSVKLRAVSADGREAVEKTIDLVVVGGAAPATLRSVGTGGRVATGLRALTNPHTKAGNRSTTFVRSATTFLEFRYPGWYISDAGPTQYVTFPAGTQVQTQFDYYANGTITGLNTKPGKVNGQAIATISGTLDWITCRIEAADYGLTQFPAGSAVCCYFEIDFLAAGGVLPLTDSTGTGSTSTGGEVFYYGGTTRIGGSPIAANGGSAVNYALRPAVVLGDGADKAVIAVGDSNTAGKECGRPAADGQTNLAGMAAFGLWNSGKAYSVFGKNGDRASFWNAAPQSDIRYSVFAWFDGVLLNMGTNDLAGATDAAVAAIADVRGMRAKIKAANTSIKIGQGYILPRTTNTGYTTVAAQTVYAGYANADALRPAYDAALAADVGTSGRNLDISFNPRVLVADTTATDKWSVGGGVANYNEKDGTHMVAAGAGRASVAYTNTVPTLLAA